MAKTRTEQRRAAVRAGTATLVCMLLATGHAAKAPLVGGYGELGYPWIVSWLAAAAATGVVNGRGWRALTLRVVVLLAVGLAHQAASFGAMMMLTLLWPGFVRHFGVLQAVSLSAGLAPFLLAGFGWLSGWGRAVHAPAPPATSDRWPRRVATLRRRWDGRCAGEKARREAMRR